MSPSFSLRAALCTAVTATAMAASHAAPQLRHARPLPAYAAAQAAGQAAAQAAEAVLDRGALWAEDTVAGAPPPRFRVRTLPASGQWRLDGQPLAAGLVFTQQQVDERRLRYQPAADGRHTLVLELLDAQDGVVALPALAVDVGRSLEFSAASPGGHQGHHLAFDGERLVASSDTLGVQVWRRDPATDRWRADGPRVGGFAGSDHGPVAIAGEWVAVGHQRFYAAPSQPGRVTLLRRDAAAVAWQPAQTLESPGLAADEAFGASVAMQGDTLAVGSGSAGFYPSTPGAVHFYRRSGDTWQHAGSVSGDTLPDGGAWGLGRSVDLDGERALVGAWMSGRAYVFRRAADGAWALEGVLDGMEAAPYLFEFGFAVGLSGERAVVGAYNQDAAAPLGAHLYERDAAGRWTWRQALSAAAGVGYSVAIDGDTVALGDLYGADGEAVQLHLRDAATGTWPTAGRWTNPAGPAARTHYAAALALAGGKLAVGSDFVWSTLDPGSVEVHDLHVDARHNAAPALRRALPLEAAAGAVTVLGAAHLAFADDGDAAARLTLTLLIPPAQARLLLRGRALAAGARFSAQDLHAGRVQLQAAPAARGDDALTLQATDALGAAAPPVTLGLRYRASP